MTMVLGPIQLNKAKRASRAVRMAAGEYRETWSDGTTHTVWAPFNDEPAIVARLADAEAKTRAILDGAADLRSLLAALASLASEYKATMPTFPYVAMGAEVRS